MNTVIPGREDFKNDNGIASWWQKDGAWHIARPEGDRGLIWTADSFDTREEAIAALS